MFVLTFETRVDTMSIDILSARLTLLEKRCQQELCLSRSEIPGCGDVQLLSSKMCTVNKKAVGRKQSALRVNVHGDEVTF